MAGPEMKPVKGVDALPETVESAAEKTSVLVNFARSGGHRAAATKAVPNSEVFIVTESGEDHHHLALRIEDSNKTSGGDGRDNKYGDEGDSRGRSSTTVVLSIEMHCKCCCSVHVSNCAKSFQGVEEAEVEFDRQRLVVKGKMDPSQLVPFLRKETNKKVELVSPEPTESNSSNKDEKHKEEEESIIKQPPKTTAVIDPHCGCQGCIDEIKQVVAKTKGVEDKIIDKEKNTVTVKGTLDTTALNKALKRKLKRVEVKVKLEIGESSTKP